MRHVIWLLVCVRGKHDFIMAWANIDSRCGGYEVLMSSLFDVHVSIPRLDVPSVLAAVAGARLGLACLL